MIDVKNLSKEFELLQEKKRSVYDYLFNRKQPNETIWALKNISFNLKGGEVLGVIGRNGSGKSTLLKILAGILQPTSGEVSVQGKILPFIELGIGFESELTGIENIHLYGAILGLTKKEISQKIQDVIDFADIGLFINAKLKTYSSGMVARLAFSTALMLDPDVLLVDEILSIGDEEFQRKSLKKMMEFKERGKTIVFVSHSMSDIRLLCDKCLFIGKDSKYIIGKPNDVIGGYLKKIYSETERQIYHAINTNNDPPQLKMLFKQANDLLDDKIQFFEKQIIEKKMYTQKAFIFNELDNQRPSLTKSLMKNWQSLIKKKKELLYLKISKNTEKIEALNELLSLFKWEINFNENSKDVEQSFYELKKMILKHKDLISDYFIENLKNLIFDIMKINNHDLKVLLINRLKDIILNLNLKNNKKHDLITTLFKKEIELTYHPEQKQKIIETQLKTNPNNNQLQKELTNIIKEQINQTNNPKQKQNLLQQLQQITETQLQKTPNDISLQKQLKHITQEQIDIIKNPEEKQILLQQLQKQLETQLKTNPNNNQLQKELTNIIKEQIKQTNNPKQKQNLLQQLQQITETQLQKTPNDISLQKQLKYITQEQIDIIKNPEEKQILLQQLQKQLEHHPGVRVQELENVITEQIEIIENKKQKIRLLKQLQRIIELHVQEQPYDIRVWKKLVSSIECQMKLTKKPSSELLNKLKDVINKRLELESNNFDCSVNNFHILLQHCPASEDNYRFMIQLLEKLNKKKFPEKTTITLIKCLQLHFLNLKVGSKDKYNECLRSLFYIINKYVKRKDNLTNFVILTIEEVAKNNSLVIPWGEELFKSTYKK